MAGVKFFRVNTRNGEASNFIDLSAAARVWSEDPEHRKVFEIIPDGDNWKPIREFSQDELLDVLKVQRKYPRAG
jgi:hypothetical protein